MVRPVTRLLLPRDAAPLAVSVIYSPFADPFRSDSGPPGPPSDFDMLDRSSWPVRAAARSAWLRVYRPMPRIQSRAPRRSAALPRRSGTALPRAAIHSDAL